MGVAAVEVAAVNGCVYVHGGACDNNDDDTCGDEKVTAGAVAEAVIAESRH